MRLQRREREEPTINLTPLIDVVFLLLIFFMVSTTFQRESDLELTLPEADTAPSEERQTRIEITIDSQGGYRINGKELVNDKLETVQRALKDRLEAASERPVVIRADARTPHEAVVRAMDAAGRLGVSKLSIATVQPDESAE